MLNVIITLITVCLICTITIVYFNIRNSKMKRKMLDERYDTQIVTDEYGITHTYIFDKKIGHVVLYEKSNGERYEFKNDNQGRLVECKNYLGDNYDCVYNSKNQITYLHDQNTDKKYGYSYNEKGQIFYQIEYNSDIEKWFDYNEHGKIYHIKDSKGNEIWNLSRMPA